VAVPTGEATIITASPQRAGRLSAQPQGATVHIEGVYTPIVTPFNADESIDEAAYAAAIERQIDSGVAGIVVGGTTGEYYAMDLDERRRQLELAATIIDRRVQLIAGCNTGATRDVIGLAQHSRRHGYDAIMLSPPPTSLPTQAQLAAHVRAGALEGGLPVILYNYPARSGVEFGFESLDLLADTSEVVAIKESSGDFSRFLALQQRYLNRLDVMCGSDDQAFDYFAWGVRSWLAGTANVLPRQHVEFVDTMLRGDVDLGRRQFAAILPFLQHVESGDYNAKVKAGLTHLGVVAGTVRRPMTALTIDEAAHFGSIIDESLRAFGATTAATAAHG
jgi:4-hydroxy-tetrahydrodipicolinate synthase